MASRAFLLVVVLGPVASFLTFPGGSHALPSRVAAYPVMVRSNVALLLVPVLATLPYVTGFHGLVAHRVLPYARLRAPTRPMLARHLAANALVVFSCFAVIALVPMAFVMWGDVPTSPGDYGLRTPADVAAAERGSATFAQLLGAGPWAMAAGYGAWLGFNAACYAVISQALLLLQPNRVVAFVGPWLAWFVAGYAMAVLGWEGYSLDLVMPFGLRQLPLWHLAVPGAALTLATGAAVAAVLVRPDRVSRLS